MQVFSQKIDLRYYSLQHEFVNLSCHFFLSCAISETLNTPEVSYLA